jgi:thiamine-monophosphate kinase
VTEPSSSIPDPSPSINLGDMYPGIDRLRDLGETAVVERILARIGPPPGATVGGGDDTAVVPFGGEDLLLTIDELVEKVDFDFAYSSGADLGWKAIAVNASDIAAMGGRPLWATVSLALPSRTELSTLDDLLDGLLEASHRWSIGVVGGDISSASELSLTVAMAGSVLGRGPVLRSGAQSGDALMVTGTLGGAAAGLRLLRHRVAGKERSYGGHPSEQGPEVHGGARGLIQRQLRPVARVEQAAALAPLSPSSMIDLSDGLARDLGRLMKASDTGCVVDPDALPVDEGLLALFGGERAPSFDMAMVGGEDFELLFTIGEGRHAAATAAVEGTGVPCTKIGHVSEAGCLVGDTPLATWEDMGWDHLRSR